MAGPEDFNQSSRSPPWREAGSRPDFVEMQGQIADLHELVRSHDTLGGELSEFFWNNGIPYVGLVSGTDQAWADACQASFSQDMSADQPESPKYHGRIEQKVTDRVGIAQRRGKQFFVRDRKHIISPPADAITPIEDNVFEIYNHNSVPFRAKLLSESEQEIALKYRARYDEINSFRGSLLGELRDRQYDMARKTLELYGIDTAIDTEGTAKDWGLEFMMPNGSYAPSRVTLSGDAYSLAVISMTSVVPGEDGKWLIEDLTKLTVPRAQQIMDRMAALPISDPNYSGSRIKLSLQLSQLEREKQKFLNEVHAQHKHFDFRFLSLQSPLPNHTIPVFMGLMRMPFDEYFKIAGPIASASHGKLSVLEPGYFTPAGEWPPRYEWQLDSRGEVRRIRP